MNENSKLKLQINTFKSLECEIPNTNKLEILLENLSLFLPHKE